MRTLEVTGRPYGVSPGISFLEDVVSLGRFLEELGRQEMQDIVREILDKRNKTNKKYWCDIVNEYNLECSPEVLRKLSVGVEFASDAGMKFDTEYINKDKVERQKLQDVQRGIRQDLRSFSRTELICEQINDAIANLPKINIRNNIEKRSFANRELILGIGDFHYGAKFQVKGLHGEILNEYSCLIFEKRMESLMNEIIEIAEKEEPEQLTILVTGDMLDGLIHQNQLQRIEFGVVESAIRLAEFLVQWLVCLENNINIPIRFYAVRGNHGEIRPLGSKAGQFPEENMERIVMHYVHARLGNEKWIFTVNDAPMTQVIDVCGYQFLLTHGQDINIESMAKDFINLYHRPIDAFFVGHLHKNQSFVSGVKPSSNVYVERVPSLCGVDPYAQSKGFSALPGATVYLVEDEYGFRCIYPIKLK